MSSSPKSKKKPTYSDDDDDIHHSDSLTISADELLARFGAANPQQQHDNQSNEAEDNRVVEEREKLQKTAGGSSSTSLAPPPIRQEHQNQEFKTYEVECWENFRWYPVIGWSNKLLPTDRFQWSSKDGTQQVTKDSFDTAQSPTDNKTASSPPKSNQQQTENGGTTFPNNVAFIKPKYDWVSEWEIYIMPRETDNEGWQYARDFPATYHPEWFVGVCVKRRMWVRRFRVPK